MARIGSPCLDCSDRHVGCHSDCEKYISYKAVLDKYNNAIAEGKAKESIIYSYKSKAIARMKRGKR